MEEFYDSLEDNFSSASSSSIPSSRLHQNSEIWETIEFYDKYNISDSSLVIIKPPSDSPKRHPSKNSIYSNSEKECSNKCCSIQNDISSIVPLYNGDKNKSEIRKSRKSSSSPIVNRKELSNTRQKSVSQDDTNSENKKTRNCPKQRSRITSYRPVQCNIHIDKAPSRIPLRSYLGMFHARMKYPGTSKKEEPSDTVRSEFGDSSRTEITEIYENEEFLDAEDSRSDTTSFYLKQIEEEEEKKMNNGSLIGNAGTHSLETTFGNSVSEVMSNSTASETKKFQLKKVRSKPLPIPVLGGLGPDLGASQEKLERRRKQLKYGQKASYRNKVKLMEIKVLKNLKDEIQKSNSVLDGREE